MHANPVSDPIQTSYDEIPYTSTVTLAAHPDHLATVARLFGLETPSPDRCRVLELGCATADNLIAIACELPNSRFVGLDFSVRQIDMAREVVRAVGLTNIELHAGNILDVGPSFGQFDYILCPGLYSWVPPEVRDKVLAICAANLAPNGVAFVNYNTYPGWHLRGATRDLLCFHGRRIGNPAERVREARKYFEALARHADAQTTYGMVLQREWQRFENQSDWYVFHDLMAEVNQPVHFLEFVEHAAGHGLQYLCEAEPRRMVENLADHPSRVSTGDLLLDEQYLDFQVGRTLRETLVCHAGQALQRPLQAGAIRQLYLTATVKVEPPPPGSPPGSLVFVSPEGSRLTSNSDLLNLALTVLNATNAATVSFADLWMHLQPRLAALPDANISEERLAALLLQCYRHFMVALHAVPSVAVLTVSERPLASPLARYQAQNERPVLNLRHRQVNLEELDRLVLPYLDGTRDREQILEALSMAVRSGAITIRNAGQPMSAAEVSNDLAGPLETSLRRLAGRALLMG